MKARFHRLAFVRSFAVAAAIIATLAALPGVAAVYTWDNGTINALGPTDGGGTWSVSGSSNWWNGSGYQFWNNFTNDTAQFGYASGNANPYTVTLDPGGVTAGGIIFQDQAYTLSGSTLTLGGSTPTINVNAGGGTIDSSIAGTAGLTMAGPGLLTLGGANTYSGTTAITGGTLALDFTQAGAPPTNILNSSTQVSFGVAGSLGAQNALTMNSSGGASTQTVGGVGLAGTSGLGTISVNGGTLNLGAISTPISNSSSASFSNYVLFKVNNGGVLTTTTSNDISSNAGLIAGRNFGGFGVIDTVVGGADNFGFAGVNLASGVIQPAATTAWTSAANTNTVNYFLNSSGTTTTNAVIASLNISPSASGLSLALNGGGSYKIRGGLILQGPNSFTISTTNSVSSLQNPANEDWPIWVMGSGNLTLAVPFVDNGASPTSTNTGSAGSISKLGPGTLIIAASCNATGSTFLDQGTIQIASSGAALPSGSLFTAPNTSLVFTSSNTFRSPINGSAQVISQPGAGNLVKILEGGATIAGHITISSGSLQIGGNGATISGAVTNNSGPLILGGGSGLITLNSQPSTSSNVFINGSGNVAINSTVSLSGSNSLTGEFYTGNNGGAGNVIVSSGTLNVGSWFEVGRLFGSTASNSTTSTFTATGSNTVVIADNFNQNNGSHAEIGWANVSGGVTTGILNILNGATFNTQNSEIHLGVNYNGGSGEVGEVILGSSSSDTASINTGNAQFFVGDAGGATGYVTINGGSLSTGNGNFLIGNNSGATGNVTVNGGSLTVWDLRNDSGAGNFTLNAGYVQVTGWMRLGINSGAVGNYTVYGGVLTNSATSSTGGTNGNLRLNIGENGTGTFTINGGLVSLTNPQNNSQSGLYVGGGNGGSGSGTLNVNGGTLATVDPLIYVGASANSNGTINMVGGRVINSGGLVLGNASGATGTLNLNSGLFQANAVTSNGGTGYLYFNGGTLQISGAGGSIAATNGGNLSLYLGQSGATIDTNGNSIQALVPLVPNPSLVGTDGGLIKLGAGVLALNSSNGQSTYQGPTQVSGGTLLVTGGLPNTSNINIASGAGLGGDGTMPSVALAASATLAPGYTILNPAQVGTISPATLTSNGGILTFKLSNSNSTGNDQINVTGNVSLTNVTFNISSLLNGALQSGSYDLLNYGSSSSLSGLTLTGLPLSRQTYSLDKTSVPNEILLDVSAASPANLVWLGTSSTTWDTSTTNWYNTSAGSADKFFNLDNVSFTDQGAAHGNISIASTFSVGALAVSLTSASSSYTFSGPGYLTGVTGLVMSGSGSVTFNTPNALTGETDLHGGSLTLGAGGAIGDASGTNVTYVGGPSAGDSASVAVHSGGTLSGASIVLGNAASSAGALTQNGGVVNVVNGNLVVGNSGAGTITQSAGVINIANGNLVVGNTGAGAINQSGGVVNVPDWFRLGEYSTGTGIANISGGTVSVGQVVRVGEMGGGTLNLSGNAVMNAAGNVELGMPVDNTNLPGSGVVNVTGNAVLAVSGEMGIGRGGGTGAVTIANNASVTVAFTIDIGDSNNNSVSPNVNVGTSSGTLTQTGGTLTGLSGAQLWVGQFDQPNVNSGLYNFSGGLLNLSNWLVVGNHGGTGVMNMSGSAVLQTSSEVHVGDGADTQPSSGTLNLYGGVMTVNNWFVVGRGGGNGVMNMTGGSLTQQNAGNFDVGTGAGSQGTFNQSGGTVNVGEQLLVPETGNATTLGTYNLSGSGVLITNTWLAVGRDGAAGNFNLSGGTLVHTANNHVTIGSGGTGVFSITGGTLVDAGSSAFVGESANGTLSIAGGAAQFNQIEMGVNAGINGTVALSGGLLSATQIYLNNASSTATLHLAGGTLQAASGAATNFLSGLTAAYLDSGTTTIDTNSQSVTIGQPLLAGSGSGGLSKVGAGMLTLAGASTYTGPTAISAGTLQLGLGGLGVGTIAHRWSFDQGTLTDSVGGLNAFLNGNSSLGTGGVTVAGNGSSHVSYVSLGDGSTNILPTTNSPYTVQVWATQNVIESWSRIWDFGNQPGTNNLAWTWTQGTSAPGVFAVNGANNNTVGFGTGTQYNMTLTATPGSGGVGTTYDWYVYNAGGSLVGSGSVATSWDISQMTQANMWLGRSEYGDNDASATYSEFRIFDAAFTPSQVAALNAAGPSASLGGPTLPTATAVTVAPGATLDVNGGSQQIASLNDATPGNGGTVVNSNTSIAAVLTLSPTGSATFSGTIAGGALGAIGLVLDGPGTQVLSGVNTYLGGTADIEGTLILANDGAIADGTSLIVGDPSLVPAVLSPLPLADAASGTRIAADQASGAVSPVPEPGTLALFAAGIVVTALAARRRIKSGRTARQ